MPFFLHAAASSSLIGRDASLMSVSPAQNFSKPPPVPEVPTTTFTPEFCSWKPSAAASDSGATVLDPSIWMVPARFGPLPEVLPVPASEPPQPASARAMPVAAAARRPRVVSESTRCSLPGSSDSAWPKVWGGLDSQTYAR